MLHIKFVKQLRTQKVVSNLMKNCKWLKKYFPLMTFVKHWDLKWQDGCKSSPTKKRWDCRHWKSYLFPLLDRWVCFVNVYIQLYVLPNRGFLANEPIININFWNNLRWWDKASSDSGICQWSSCGYWLVWCYKVMRSQNILRKSSQRPLWNKRFEWKIL